MFLDNRTMFQRRHKRSILKEKITNDTAKVVKLKSSIKNLDKKFQLEVNMKSKKSINVHSVHIKPSNKRQIFDFDLPDSIRLFAGYVFISSPHRHKSSKWYISLKEYPYDLWPPYITAGAFVLSKEALLDMYYGSMYTKHFRFDDIYLGLIAKKLKLELFHCEQFHFYKKDYSRLNYKYVITSHGYENSEELLKVWNEQKALGNA